MNSLRSVTAIVEKYLPAFFIVPATVFLLCMTSAAQADPLKVGLLADSHLQTDKATKRVKWQKGGLESTVVRTALRPLELDMGASDLLQSFLDKMKEEKVDMILYLGDGANNGCADELGARVKNGRVDRFEVDGSGKGVLSILSRFREKSGIPIFYIVGNHDYLGAGNTTQFSQRARLCDDSQPYSRNAKDFSEKFNRPIMKHNLIELLHDFNGANIDTLKKSKFKTGKIKKLSYKDNFGDNENALKLCTNEAYKIEKGELSKLPSDLEEFNPGCFLSGRVQFYFDKNEQPYEILLVDTSDYYGYAPKDYYASSKFSTGLIRFWSDKLSASLLKTDYWGDKTWISFPNDWTSFAEGNISDQNIHQTEWFARINEEDRPKKKPVFTMVASHYDPAQVLSQVRDDKTVQKLCNIFDNPAGENPNVYWVSAHTHTDIPSYRFNEPISTSCNGDRKYNINSLNIGSTTDFKPQSVIVSVDGSQITPQNVRILQWADKDRNVNSRECRKTEEQKQMECKGQEDQQKKGCNNTTILLNRECCDLVENKYTSIKETRDFPEDSLAADYSAQHVMAEAKGYVMDDAREYVRRINYAFNKEAYRKAIEKLALDELLKTDLKSHNCDTRNVGTLIKQCIASYASEKNGPMLNEECYAPVLFSESDFPKPFSATDLCTELQSDVGHDYPSAKYVNGLSSEGLCKVISRDLQRNIPGGAKHKDYNKCLKTLLRDPALYNKLAKKHPAHIFRPEFVRIKEKCDKSGLPLERCNLAVMEEFHPHRTVKGCTEFLNGLLIQSDLETKLTELEKNKSHYTRPEYIFHKRDYRDAKLQLEEWNRAIIEEFYMQGTEDVTR